MLDGQAGEADCFPACDETRVGRTFLGNQHGSRACRAGACLVKYDTALQNMKAGVKWFVEIIEGRERTMRIEPCASLQEARKIAEEVESGVDFDRATDSIAIHRGASWATAKLYE